MKPEVAAGIAAYEAQTALKAAQLAVEKADAIPPPPPEEPPFLRELAKEDGRMLARLSPRRNRWQALAEIDARIREIERQQDELRTRLHELHEERIEDKATYALRLADWNGQGPRPAPKEPELERQLEETQADLAAADVRLDRLLAERVAYVERHRKALVRDAERAVATARAAYETAVTGAARAREELVAARLTATWATLFPSETLRSDADTRALAGARKEPQARHLPGIETALPAVGVFALLADDAHYLAVAQTVEQAAAARGATPAALTTGRAAMWGGSEEEREWQRRENERLREAHRREWGRDPA